MIPLFGVLYWFSIEHGSWLVVFVVHVIVSLAAARVLMRQTTVHSAVTETELIGNGIFSPMIRVPLDDDRARSTWSRPMSGRRPSRSRSCWSAMPTASGCSGCGATSITTATCRRSRPRFPVKPHVASEPINITEFFRTYPGSAYWFEHRPILRIVVFALALVAALGDRGVGDDDPRDAGRVLPSRAQRERPNSLPTSTRAIFTPALTVCLRRRSASRSCRFASAAASRSRRF